MRGGGVDTPELFKREDGAHWSRGVVPAPFKVELFRSLHETLRPLRQKYNFYFKNRKNNC